MIIGKPVRVPKSMGEIYVKERVGNYEIREWKSPVEMKNPYRYLDTKRNQDGRGI